MSKERWRESPLRSWLGNRVETLNSATEVILFAVRCETTR